MKEGSSDSVLLQKLPAPEPSLGWEEYRREREAALAFDPRRRENYERYQKSLRRLATVDYLPIILDIENVSRCNYRCTMCQVQEFKKGKRARDLTLEEFRALIDDQYGLLEIKLHGVGEPTMQGNDFFEMIRYARSKHIWVRTVTNGSLLHIRENYRVLVDTGVNEIQISIDGADKEVYESIRRLGNFERVKDNCLLINRYCRERARRVTKMWTVVQRENLHQLEALVDLAAELEFPFCVFSLQVFAWGSAVLAENLRAMNVAQDLAPDRLRGLVARGEARGVQVRFWTAAENYSFDSPQTRCPWPFERAYIGSDGRTVPCCMIGNPDLYEIGKGMTFTEAWRSKEYESFREAHLSGNIPDVCKNCYVHAETDRKLPQIVGAMPSVRTGS